MKTSEEKIYVGALIELLQDAVVVDEPGGLIIGGVRSYSRHIVLNVVDDCWCKIECGYILVGGVNIEPTDLEVFHKPCSNGYAGCVAVRLYSFDDTENARSTSGEAFVPSGRINFPDGLDLCAGCTCYYCCDAETPVCDCCPGEPSDGGCCSSVCRHEEDVNDWDF